MTYFVACLVEGFLDTNAEGDAWRARPLATRSETTRGVVRAWIESYGATLDEWAYDDGPRSVDLYAIEARVAALDVDHAYQLAASKLEAITAAIAFRQLRPVRILAWICVPEEGGPTHVRHSYSDPPKVYTTYPGGGWSASRDIEDIARAIRDSPTGQLYSQLLSEALAYEAPETMLVSLWSILESMSQRFRKPHKENKAELRMVQRALAYLGMDEPDRRRQLSRAYHIRNVAIHQGLRGSEGDVLEIRSALVRATFEALARARFAQVEPDSPRPARAGAPKAMRRIAVASDPPPE